MFFSLDFYVNKVNFSVIVYIEQENLYIFWATWGISMKFSSKIWDVTFMIILRVTKKQGFTPSLKKALLEKPQAESNWHPPSLFRVNPMVEQNSIPTVVFNIWTNYDISFRSVYAFLPTILGHFARRLYLWCMLDIKSHYKIRRENNFTFRRCDVCK